MTFFNYRYNLNNGQTYSYQQKTSDSSGSTGSFGSTSSSGSATSSDGTVIVGSLDSAGSVGSVGQLSLEQIMNLFESGNLTFEEF